MGPLKPIATKGQAETVSPATQVTSAPNNTDAVSNANTSSNPETPSTGNVQQMLQDAKAQIQTKETADYYDKLVAGYDIQDTTLNQSQILDASSVLSAIPDIQKISNNAATMPLIEAGKNINDEDIAKFYYKLLQDSGWDIKP